MGSRVSEEDTYLRAKLTEINSSIERLTEMLNRMIDVISRIGEVQEATTDLSVRIAENSRKLDQIMLRMEGTSTGVPTSSGRAVESKGAVSAHAAILDNLEGHFREGIIASDLAAKISEAATALEEKGMTGGVIVKMNRWVRILRTYGRVDSISPTDLGKLRTDIREWQKELASSR